MHKLSQTLLCLIDRFPERADELSVAEFTVSGGGGSTNHVWRGGGGGGGGGEGGEGGEEGGEEVASVHRPAQRL